MAIIDDKTLKQFIESPVNTDFNLSISDIASQVTEIGRFSAWLNGDKSKIENVLQTVKDAGVSPAFFAAYEKTEDYNSKWGWLNHTSPTGGPVKDAKSVSNWIVSQSNDTSSGPTWIDYANYNNFVPQSVKDKGNAHFADMPKGTIGRVVIPGTAAATWEVYYPKGLKAEYNGVQNYGKPITGMKDAIEAWGGSSSGGQPSFIFPTGTENVTSGFRPPSRPNHHGVDFADGSVHDIIASAGGTISRSYLSSSYGECVFIKHEIDGQTWETVYAHMQSGSRTVSKGDTVSQGNKLGIMGSTGDSSGLHLHFELHKGRWNVNKTNAVDPLDYLGKGGTEPPEPKPPETDDEANIIRLLLSGALEGW